MTSKFKLPILLIVAVSVVLAMLRLGVWQLDRADSKSQILQQQRSKAAQLELNLNSLVDAFDGDAKALNGLRFTPVIVTGRYLSMGTILVDNQVHQGKVGYQVYSPFQVIDSAAIILVNRGWVSVGESRQVQPTIDTPLTEQTLSGRLNYAHAKPPLWNDKYTVSQGSVWAYLPIPLYAKEFELKPLSLVLELAPDVSGSQFKIAWAEIDDEWVAKHQGYAFQWFAMALAFFIACLVLLIKKFKRHK